MMHKWYVVQVMSTHEKKVKKALEEHRELKGMGDVIEKVLLPIENVSEVKKGQQKVVEKRLWPGYLLIKMILTDESWLYVKNTAGVFVNFIGTVTDVFHEKGRLSVSVSIFGRETRVDDLEFSQVEEIT